MAEVDTSIYKDAVAENPLDVQNKLLQTYKGAQDLQLGQQAMQSNQIKLATERFANINNAASGILSDPDLGKKDVTGKLWDVMGRLTKGDAMSAQHAVQFMQQFPTDPQQQAQAIKAVHAQTLDAWQKGQAYLGQTQEMATGGGTKFIGAPAFGGPVQDRGYVANTLPPGTTQTNPDLSQSYVGGTGNPAIQGPPGTMPPVNGAPARPKVASTNRLIGDDEAARTGLYPAAPGATPAASPAAPPAAPAPNFAQRFDASRPAGTVTAAPSPGEAEALKGSTEAYNAARDTGAKYAQRVNPLRQAIPLLEKMKDTEIGPSSERWNDIKSTAQTLGAGTLAGIDPEKIKNYNELKKYFSQYTSQAAATMGPKTNDGLATAVTSNPNVHMDKLSATDLSKMALGAERMQQAGLHEFQELVRQGKAKPGNFADFMVDWGTKQDPRAFVYDIMDKKAQDAVKKLPAAERAKVAEGMRIAEKWKLLGDVHRE